MRYRAQALLPPGVEVSIPSLAETVYNLLTTRGVPASEVKVSTAADRLVAHIGDWWISLTLNEMPHVIEESREIAEDYAAERPDSALIAACDRRIEVSSAEDPDMDYFNDYLFVLEPLEALGAILFDDETEMFL